MTPIEEKLSLLDHFKELRKRLIRSVLALVVTVIISFFFWRWIFYILTYPTHGATLYAFEMTETFGITMKVCLGAGLIIAMPYITYQAIMFIRPALTDREKRYLYIVMPWVTVMFLGGVVFGYFILVPPAVRFLMSWGSDIVKVQVGIDNYISVVTRLLLIIGLVFELPVVSTFLARIGIIKPEWLASKRKIAIVIAFVLAAIITPTFDPVNQSLVAVPLVVLYEMSIWLAKLVYRRKEAMVTEEAYEAERPGLMPGPR
jgi:sec-independent protein translocase protein TatC